MASSILVLRSCSPDRGSLPYLVAALNGAHSLKHAAPAQDASLDGATIRGTFGEYNRFYFSRDAPQGRFLGLASFPLRKCALRSKNVQDVLSGPEPTSHETPTTRPAFLPNPCNAEVTGFRYCYGTYTLTITIEISLQTCTGARGNA